jgi:ribose/xylose/arabinose/galactoside ABC-type transport system permease subunit
MKIPPVIKAVINKKEIGVLIPLILISLITGIINPVFFGIQNVMNILFQASFVGIICIGMTYVLIVAGIDLSVGSTLALGGIITGLLMVNFKIPVPIAVAIGSMIGITSGFLIGLMVTKFRLTAIISTLAMMYIVRGFCEYLTKGETVYPLPRVFALLGQGRIMLTATYGIQYFIIIAIVLIVAGQIILTKTVFGRELLAIGGNAEVAKLSGINVNRNIIIAYIISGFTAAMSGIFTASRLGSAVNNAGTGWELNVIAACIIGGTSSFGGVGSVVGSAIGAVLMTVITNAMTMIKLSVYLQKVVIGLIIVFAVAVDQYNRKRTLN